MKAKPGILLFLLLLCCLSLEASVFSSRNSLQQLRGSSAVSEEEEDDSLASQVPDVKSKAPRIYERKKDKEKKAKPAETSSSLSFAVESAVAMEPIEGETVAVFEGSPVVEEEAQAEVFTDNQEREEAPVFFEKEAAEATAAGSIVLEVVERTEPSPGMEDGHFEEGTAATEGPESRVVRPHLSKALADAAVAVVSMCVSFMTAVVLRKALPCPMSFASSFAATLLFVLVPLAISLLAAGWSWSWLCYLVLLSTFFILRSGSR